MTNPPDRLCGAHAQNGRDSVARVGLANVSHKLPRASRVGLTTHDRVHRLQLRRRGFGLDQARHLFRVIEVGEPHELPQVPHARSRIYKSAATARSPSSARAAASSHSISAVTSASKWRCDKLSAVSGCLSRRTALYFSRRSRTAASVCRLSLSDGRFQPLLSSLQSIFVCIMKARPTTLRMQNSLRRHVAFVCAGRALWLVRC
jgi:hypothetical protein